MRFLAPTLDNADPLFALVITTGIYLNHVGVADQDATSGRVKEKICRLLRDKVPMKNELEKQTNFSIANCQN